MFDDASMADLVQDCSNSSANELELLQSCIKPLIYITQPPGLQKYADSTD